MDNEFYIQDIQTFTLEYEDGSSQEYEVIAVFDYEEGLYIAAAPLEGDGDLEEPVIKRLRPATIWMTDRHLTRSDAMNIQIFGTKKSSDTRKAERWFKERRIRFQYIDLAEKGISKGELRSVAQAVGGIEALIDEKAKDAYAVSLVQHTPATMMEDVLLENQQVLRAPIVRNGRQATVGYAPDIWKTWE